MVNPGQWFNPDSVTIKKRTTKNLKLLKFVLVFTVNSFSAPWAISFPWQLPRDGKLIAHGTNYSVFYLGAHYNPAVSLAMLMTGRMKVLDFLIYICAQFIGGFLVKRISFYSKESWIINLLCFFSQGSCSGFFGLLK